MKSIKWYLRHYKVIKIAPEALICNNCIHGCICMHFVSHRKKMRFCREYLLQHKKHS